MQTIARENSVMDELKRYTLLIDQFLPTNASETTQPMVRRLVRARRVSQWTHRSGLRYWTVRAPRPLSDRSLARAFGILLFCRQSATRSLVTTAEIESYFPTLFRHGLPGGHYVDSTYDSSRLGHVRVDGSCSKVSRIVSCTAKMIHDYRKQPGFRDLIDSDRFELTWLVPTKPKQHRVATCLQPLTASGIPIRVCAIPELLNLLAPISPD